MRAIVSTMVLPMPLRRWLPAVLLLAALGCAIAPAQTAQPVGGPYVAAGTQHRVSGPGTVGASKQNIDTAQAPASLLPAKSARVDAVLAVPHPQSPGCGDEAWAGAATLLDVVYRGADAAELSAALTPPGDLPSSGALNRLALDPGAACPVGLLLADLSVHRT